MADADAGAPPPQAPSGGPPTEGERRSADVGPPQGTAERRAQPWAGLALAEGLARARALGHRLPAQPQAGAGGAAYPCSRPACSFALLEGRPGWFLTSAAPCRSRRR